MAISIGYMDFRPIFLMEIYKGLLFFFFKEWIMEQKIIPTAKTMAAKSEPVVKKHLGPALQYISTCFEKISERALAERMIRINGSVLYDIYDNNCLYSLFERQLVQYLRDELGYEVEVEYVDFIRMHMIIIKW